jgi:hypothetical protein
LVNFIEDVITSEGVSGQFVLPHTDQTGFQDESGNSYQNWYYTATISYSAGKTTLPSRTKTFQLPTGQTVVDLDLLPAGAPVLPYTAQTAVVTSFAGRTGAITVQDSDLPTRLSDASLGATYSPLTVGGKTAVRKDELIVNVKDYGVKGDAVRNTSGGSITSGSATFTGTGFTTADVGKFFAVVGAGASGATLTTTISGYTNATTVTLAASASTTVSNAAYLYGTDDTAAIQAVLDGVNDSSYTQVFFPKGSYLTGGLLLKNNTQLIGAGRGAWAYEFYSRVTRLIAKPGMTAPGLVNDYTGQQVGNVRVTDMMLDGAKAFHATAKAGIYLSDSALSADSLWSVERVYVGFFSGDGIYLGAFRRANRFNDCHVWQCTGNATTVAGSDNAFFQTVFAQCGGDGINITQSTNHFINCDIFSNLGAGVNIAALGRMSMFTNCAIDVNAKQGVLNAAKNLSLTQCRFTSNSQSADGVYADVEITGGAQGCTLTNPTFYVATGTVILPDVPLKAPGNSAGNPVFMTGFSYDPSITSWRNGSYTTTSTALLYKGFAIADGSVITMGSTNGVKLGGASTEKIGFYGATAIVRPTKPANATDLATAITAVNDLIAKLSASSGGVGLIS